MFLSEPNKTDPGSSQPFKSRKGEIMELEDLRLKEWLVVILMFTGYFLSSFIAMLRNHKNKLAILLMNIFLGWTFLGWISALIWAVTK